MSRYSGEVGATNDFQVWDDNGSVVQAFGYAPDEETIDLVTIGPGDSKGSLARLSLPKARELHAARGRLIETPARRLERRR